MTKPDRTSVSQSPEDTQRLAADLLAVLQPGAVLALHGELGSGKTCFVQGLAKAHGIACAVNSPTFAIVNEYPGNPPLYHMDLYRISDPQELLNLDFEDYLDAQGITVIEWAERSGQWLPDHAMHIYFETGTELNTRTITMVSAART